MGSGLRLEETELRLGLPGGSAGESAEASVRSSGKRGFMETIDLKLKLQTPVESKELESTEKGNKASDPHEKPPAPKAQVVGWPPVRSFRKNIIINLQQQSESKSKEEQSEKGAAVAAAAAAVAAFVKVSMDGAPYLRKVDLKIYKSYQDLSTALQKMFSSFGTSDRDREASFSVNQYNSLQKDLSGNYGCEQGVSVRDFMNGGKVTALVINGSEYVPTYEDKDGDWMLVGDVPWEMFVDSCKRLRVMKGSEAVGLAPRAMEKCKNRG